MVGMGFNNLNGWDESFNIILPRTFVTNNNQFMRDNSNCYVNFSSYCILDVVNDLFSDSLQAYDSTTYYRLLKETSRGTEILQTIEEINFLEESCSVTNTSMITDTINASTSGSFYIRDVYANRQVNISLDYEGDCMYWYPDYKWMYSIKAFENGSRIILAWDNNNIDSLPDAYDITDFDEDNLPPNQIENQFIDEFLERPSMPVGFDAGHFTMTSENLDAIVSSLSDYTYEKYNNNEFSWVEYFVGNINDGYASLIVEQSSYYNSSVYCVKDGNELFYQLTNLGMIAYFIDSCIKLVDESGHYIFSRSSTHNSVNSNFTVSPYSSSDLVSLSNIQSEIKNNTKDLLDEETESLKRNRIQGAASIEK